MIGNRLSVGRFGGTGKQTSLWMRPHLNKDFETKYASKGETINIIIQSGRNISIPIAFVAIRLSGRPVLIDLAPCIIELTNAAEIET